MIVAENRGFRREIIWDFFSLIWDFFAIFCQASRYRAWFQASSGHSNSANRPGYEAGLVLHSQWFIPKSIKSLNLSFSLIVDFMEKYQPS